MFCNAPELRKISHSPDFRQNLQIPGRILFSPKTGLVGVVTLVSFWSALKFTVQSRTARIDPWQGSLKHSWSVPRRQYRRNIGIAAKHNSYSQPFQFRDFDCLECWKRWLLARGLLSRIEHTVKQTIIRCQSSTLKWNSGSLFKYISCQKQIVRQQTKLNHVSSAEHVWRLCRVFLTCMIISDFSCNWSLRRLFFFAWKPFAPRAYGSMKDLSVTPPAGHTGVNIPFHHGHAF